MTIEVFEHPFDPWQAVADYRSSHLAIGKSGASAVFVGTMRDFNEGDDVQAMVLEHYPGMTESAIAKIAKQAADRWNLADVLVIHRYGPLKPGAPIMMVATASAHRAAAFEAADFLMDYLKSRAPFWKKEITTEGASWVAAKDADEDALNRW